MMDRRPYESSVRDGRHPDHDPRRDNNTHAGPGQGMLAAFMPGQKAALAEQMNAGFGGGEGQWQKMMSRSYAPIRNAANFRYGALGGGGGGGGNNPGGDQQPTLPADVPHTGAWNPGSPIGQASLSPEMLAMIRDNLKRQGM